MARGPATGAMIREGSRRGREDARHVRVPCSIPMSLRDDLARTPPMGWNSWDSYGMTVTESEVEATAGYMAKQLRRHGWQFVVIDGGWSMPGKRTPVAGRGEIVPHEIDEYGRFTPALDRFPSAANGVGFRALA